MKNNQRPRRLRGNERLRKMVRETRIDEASLIYPVFVIEGDNIKEEILSMPGQYRYSIDRLLGEIKELIEAGISSLLLFGIPKEKDAHGKEAYKEDGIVQRALIAIKKEYPQIYCITDVCMCEYTSHGHCGILRKGGVDNDETLTYLNKIALSHVRAGADMVAPSDMMDHRIASMRKFLDEHDYKEIPIMSYAVKYASSFYGPFRDAADSAPAFGDRKSYQMDYHNALEGEREAMLDIEEGADIVMVKPALAYQDMIRRIKEISTVPVSAYSVSGEYAMVKAAALQGWIDEEQMIGELAIAAYRSGASVYITYFAKEIAKLIREGRIG